MESCEVHSKEAINILLVDDKRENLLALEAVLASPNYNLVSVTSGEEALRLLLSKEFAVILLDVQMPGLNGFETAKLIKERKKTRHIPIIFITALSKAPEHVINGYKFGAVDYIFKPFEPEVLKLKIEEFVRIFQDRQEIKLQRKLLQKRSLELEITNDKLQLTTAYLQKAEALARVIAETSVDSIVTYNSEGIILLVNPAVLKMFGYSKENLVGKKIFNLIPALKKNLPEKSNHNVDGFLETVAVKQDGSHFFAEVSIGTTSIDEQNIFVCNIRDISERKQNEEKKNKSFNEQLKSSQNHFRKIFESSPSLISIKSLKDGRYIDVNKCWQKYTGYSYEEVINTTTTQDFLNIYDNDAGQQDIKRQLNTEKPILNAQVKYTTKKGEEREGLLSTEFLEVDGEKCLLSVVTDITEKVFMEKNMARLESLNLVGEMAAGIAHEIRNPMTTVRGFLELARTNPKIISQNVQLMLDELDRANTIITEFLSFAKNKVDNNEKVQLNDIIEALFPLIQAEALRNDKYVALDLGNCPQLRLNEKEMRQLILNLAINGLEAMSTKGRKLSIRTFQLTKEVVFEVTDEGCGISSEQLEKIWQPFYTTKEKGTGLGLSVCYSIAERHNALIEVNTSELGTSFLVRFKLEK